jgi:hypothetical protein
MDLEKVRNSAATFDRIVNYKFIPFYCSKNYNQEILGSTTNVLKLSKLDHSKQETTTVFRNFIMSAITVRYGVKINKCQEHTYLLLQNP